MYVEGFSPFLIGVFWALMNSVHQPAHAKKTYGLIVSCSKLAGIFFAVFASNFFRHSNFLSYNFDLTKKISLIILLASLLLIAGALFLYLTIKKLNNSAFEGYYTNIVAEKSKKTGMLLGLSLLVKNKYVLGIFLIVFLGDIVSEIINYKRILLIVSTKEQAKDLAMVLSSLYSQISYMHLIGLALSLFFTNSIMRFINTRICIFIMPVFTLLLSLAYIITGIDSLIIWLYIIIKAMHYTIGTPIRESLYIVTSKDIQFKAKFTIDAIGQKLAKNTGHAINFSTNILSTVYAPIYGILSINFMMLFIPILWIISAYFVGKKYKYTLDKKEIIS